MTSSNISRLFLPSLKATSWPAHHSILSRLQVQLLLSGQTDWPSFALAILHLLCGFLPIKNYSIIDNFLWMSNYKFADCNWKKIYSWCVLLYSFFSTLSANYPIKLNTMDVMVINAILTYEAFSIYILPVVDECFDENVNFTEGSGLVWCVYKWYHQSVFAV